jgi:putative ABC transport system permease protein
MRAAMRERMINRGKNMSFVRDLRVAAYSLIRTPGLAIAVVLTLALGIGANAASFTLVRGVLLKPLVNRDEDRLIYIRQSAPRHRRRKRYVFRTRATGLACERENPERLWRLLDNGLHHDRPRSASFNSRWRCRRTYFDVMGLRPVLGRLIGPQDDGPKAAGVVVLTYRFWTTALHKDPSVIGKSQR